MHYAFFLEHPLFLFLVLFCFVCCNKWLDQIMFLLEKLPCFSFAKNALVFTLVKNRVFFFFCYCFWLSFFALVFVQILFYLCIKVYFDLCSMLVFLKRVSSKRF
jgi:hypothetical protein